MGRNPKPTALKEASGNPGHRRLNEREPKPDSGTPEVPKWLSKAGRKVWKQTVPLLSKMKVLTTADGEALASYCQACATLEQALREVEQNGITITIYETGEDGKILKDGAGKLMFIPISVKTNPAVTIADKAMKMKRALGGDFGLTPASRARLHTEHGDEEPDTMDLLMRKKSASAATQ